MLCNYLHRVCPLLFSLPLFKFFRSSVIESAGFGGKICGSSKLALRCTGVWVALCYLVCFNSQLCSVFAVLFCVKFCCGHVCYIYVVIVCYVCAVFVCALLYVCAVPVFELCYTVLFTEG